MRKRPVGHEQLAFIFQYPVHILYYEESFFGGWDVLETRYPDDEIE